MLWFLAQTDSKISERGPNYQEIYSKSLQAYRKKNYKEAEQLIKNNWQKIAQLSEGCSLLISIHAEAKNFSHLEKVSRYCLEIGQKGDGIVFDGLAASLSSQDKTKEAIKIFEELTLHHNEERAFIALANLYYLDNEYQKARALYLKVIDSSDIWSAWLSSLLKAPKVVDDVNFIKSLVKVVLKKEKTFMHVEKKLQAYARKYSLHENLASLMTRDEE